MLDYYALVLPGPRNVSTLGPEIVPKRSASKWQYRRMFPDHQTGVLMPKTSKVVSTFMLV